MGGRGWRIVLSVGFVEVSRKVWGMYPIGEHKYVAIRGCVYICVGAAICLFQGSFELVGFVFRKGE